MALYLGAGGGGDTNAAILRALGDRKAVPKYVLGAGYDASKYMPMIQAQIKGDDATKYSLARKYLEAVAEPFSDVFRLKADTGAHTPTMQAVFGTDYATVPRYSTLLDEALFLTLLRDKLLRYDPCLPLEHQLQNNVYLFFSVAKFDKDADTYRMYLALKTFIQQKNIKEVVIMDFGGDVFDFTSLERDTAVLLTVLHIAKELGLTVVVEVYGPGVDAHACLDEVIANLPTLNRREASMADLESFLHLLISESCEVGGKDGLVHDVLAEARILGPGRATGNYVHAYHLCNNTGRSISAGDMITYMDTYLAGRHDFKKASPEHQVLFREDYMSKMGLQEGGVPNIARFRNFAKAFFYTFDPTTHDALIGLLEQRPVARENMQKLRAAISQ